MRAWSLAWALGAAAVAGCGGGSGGGDSAPAANLPPVAVAGPDQVVDEQNPVMLDGTASSDADGGIGSYQWTQLSGSSVTLSNAATATASFTAPALSVAETLSFQLRITDTRGAVATDVVDVTVNPLASLNVAPQAETGADRSVRELGSVQLDGSASSDVDGTIASYLWQQISGPALTLVNAGSARASFTAPAAPATIELELIVIDNEGAAGSSRMLLTVVPASIITVSGTVTFDRVPVGGRSGPFSSGAMLDYPATFAAPARGVTVQLIDAVDGSTVLASGRSDAAGDFSLSAPNLADAFVRVRAELLQGGIPGWNFRVTDNTAGDALYVVDGAEFSTGSTDLIRDLHAASGWNGVGYAAPRAAAPLAILDTIRDGIDLVLSADPVAVFDPMTVHWSPDNRPVYSASGSPDPTTGEIGTSFYQGGAGGGIFLLGAENDDTEEYDQHVIAHEWGHYLEDTFSRSDSVGGPHTRGDQLDMRVAFGEGWGNALSAMVTGDSVYRDTLGPGQQSGFDIDMEQESRLRPGWYSEQSIQEILYDLFDDNPDVQSGTGVADLVNLGFGPIFEVFTGAQRTVTALTSVFPFMNAIKAANPASAAAIDQLLGVQQIAVIGDNYGSTETNAGTPASADVLPIYASITVNGGAVNVCSTDEFSGSLTGSVNKLGSRRFLRFQAGVTGSHTIRATTTAAPAGASTDPDMLLHRVGAIAFSNGSPADTCAPDALDQCVERFSRTLQAGTEYIIEVYEWTNTNDSDDAFPPIGRACFDVEVTQP
jgi:hypothetical protein